MSRTEAYLIHKPQYDGWRNILGLLNKLNAIQIRKGEDVSATGQRISQAFGKINRSRAMIKRAHSGKWNYAAVAA